MPNRNVVRVYFGCQQTTRHRGGTALVPHRVYGYFGYWVSCRSTDLLVKEASLGREPSNPRKEFFHRTCQTRNLVSRTRIRFAVRRSRGSQRPKAPITGRIPESNHPLPIETASPGHSPCDGPSVTRPHPLPAFWLSDGLRILPGVSRAILGSFTPGVPPKDVTILLLRG